MSIPTTEPQLYTMQSTGTFTTTDGKESYFFTAGTVIPMALAIRMNLPGAGYVSRSPFTTVEEQRILDLIAANAGGGSVPMHLPLTSGENYDSSSAFGGITITTVTLTANRLYAVPIRLDVARSIDTVVVPFTAGAVGSARAGIYSVGANGLPSALLLDAGTVDTNDTSPSYAIAGSPVALEPGFYFLALVANSTPTLTGFTANSDQIVTDGAGGYASHRWQSFTYGALPNPFGSAFYATTAAPLLQFMA